MSTVKKTLSLDERTVAILEAVDGSASDYVDYAVTKVYDRARWAMIQFRSLSRPAPKKYLMALVDIMNGHFWTEGLRVSDELVMCMEDIEPEIIQKWEITAKQWTKFKQDVAEQAVLGEALKVLIQEFWDGNQRFEGYPEGVLRS